MTLIPNRVHHHHDADDDGDHDHADDDDNVLIWANAFLLDRSILA